MLAVREISVAVKLGHCLRKLDDKRLLVKTLCRPTKEFVNNPG